MVRNSNTPVKHYPETFDCKLLGLTIDEILNDGYNGRLSRLTYHDWKYIAEKVEEGKLVEEVIEGYSEEDLNEETELAYQQGVQSPRRRLTVLEEITYRQ